MEKKGYNARVTIVDGGSKDKTLRIADDLDCEIIQQWGEGKGAGIRQAFKKFLESDSDILVMLDSDGTYHPEEIPMFEVSAIPKDGIAMSG